MAIKQIMKFRTEDGAEFEDGTSAGKHDLAISAGTTTDALGLLGTILSDAKRQDIEAAFTAVVDGGPIHPIEEALRHFADVFALGRRIRAEEAEVGQAPRPDVNSPAYLSAQAEIIERMAAIPDRARALMPALTVAPEAPRPNIFG